MKYGLLPKAMWMLFRKSYEESLFNILSCAMFSAVYLSLPEKPDVDTMQEYYRTAMDTPIMRNTSKEA